MKKHSLFAKLGLPRQAENIYQALLKGGPTTLAGLAKATGLYRPLLYRQLPLLLDKNLISETKEGKRTVYTAENPNNLQFVLEDLQAELQERLPVLQHQFEHASKKPAIRYFQGRDGIAYVFDYLVTHTKKGDVLYRYESSADYTKHKKYYSKSYWHRATGASWEMQKFVITNEATQNRRRNRIERYSKAIPKSFDPFEYNITQIIYGDNVAFIDYDSETASLVENAKFAKFQRQIYKLLFSKLA